MKYCANCGNQLEEEAAFCPQCGARQSGTMASKQNGDDAPSFGYAFLAFFFPMIGLILYIVWNKDYPLRAKSCAKGAVIGFIINVVLGICLALAEAGYFS